MNFCMNNRHDETRVLLHALILRVKVLEDLLNSGSHSSGSTHTSSSASVAPSPQQFNSLLISDEKFSELQNIVMHLAENDVENSKESKKWTSMLVEHANGIRDIKEKLRM